MKLLFTIFILFLSYDCIGQSENVYSGEEVMELNDLFYKKKDTTLITGKVNTYDIIGKKIILEKNFYLMSGI
mgnify:CR=1 FL=1